MVGIIGDQLTETKTEELRQNRYVYGALIKSLLFSVSTED